MCIIIDSLTHAQTLLLCENLQPKKAATEGTTDQSDQLRPTTVPAHVSLNRGHMDSEPASAVNGVSTVHVACSSLSAGIVVDAPLNYSEPSHTQYESSALSQLRTEYLPLFICWIREGPVLARRPITSCV